MNYRREKMDITKAGKVLLMRQKDVARYAHILELYKISSISTDEFFQKKFNAFYRVRRGAEWRKIFYEIFDRNKSSIQTFEEVLIELYEKTGNIEGSYTSKLLATVNPNLPIWDQYVLKNIGLKLTGATKEDRIKNAIGLYAIMLKWYEEFLLSSDGKACIEEFDACFPQYNDFSNTKKVDFILWCSRD